MCVARNLKLKGTMSKHRMAKAPSLVDLCVWTAIDNLKYLGDVGGTDLNFLAKILQHCTVSVGRDLSPATDSLWGKFYWEEFEVRSVKSGDYECFREEALSTVTRKNFASKWRFRFEVGMNMRELKEKNSTSVLMEKYSKEDRSKANRYRFVPKFRHPAKGASVEWTGLQCLKYEKQLDEKVKDRSYEKLGNAKPNGHEEKCSAEDLHAPPKKKPMAFSRNSTASSSMIPKPKGRF